MDAAIEAIKKDPEMRHMWGMGDRFKVQKKTAKDLKIAKNKKKSKIKTA